jgi:hypothetical protein
MYDLFSIYDRYSSKYKKNILLYLTPFLHQEKQKSEEEKNN